MFCLVVLVRCCHRYSGFLTSYEMHFSARILLRRVYCSGHETNIEQCSLNYSSSCPNDLLSRVSCNTGMRNCYHRQLCGSRPRHIASKL